MGAVRLSRGSLNFTRWTAAWTRALAFSVAATAIVVNPTALLADVGHLQHVGIEAGALDGATERALVHARAAGSNHDAGEPVLRGCP